MVQRQQQQDAGFLVPLITGLSERQYQLFFVVQGTLHRLAQTEEFPVDDRIIRDTAQALAATYETASKGIIYEHRASSLPAERLTTELKPLLEGQDGKRPVANEKDLAQVLRRIEQAATGAKSALEDSPTAYLDLVGRIMRSMPSNETAPEARRSDDDGPRVIIP